MIITVEISMYPFQENFRDLIQDFVAKLNGYEELRVTTGPTSTVKDFVLPLLACFITKLSFSIKPAVFQAGRGVGP